VRRTVSPLPLPVKLPRATTQALSFLDHEQTEGRYPRVSCNLPPIDNDGRGKRLRGRRAQSPEKGQPDPIERGPLPEPEIQLEGTDAGHSSCHDQGSALGHE
jgi:hypothetical protein